MFGLILNDMKEALQSALDAPLRLCVGFAFALMAMVAIQYDEIVAPKVHGFSDGIGSVATDMSRRLSSFTL